MAAILNGGELTLSGDVGDDWFGDGFTYAEVVVALAQVDDNAELLVRLNSGGGIASEGAAIYALLSGRTGTTNVLVEGIAASAASLIAMAGETVTMADGAIMMIHDPMNISIGNSDDHAKSIEYLEALATSYARVYAAKSGKTPEECRTIMKAERWLTADQAIAEGFADAPGETKAKAVAAFDYRAYARAPKRLTALAAKKNWRLPDADAPAASAAPTSQHKDQSMTDKAQADDATAKIAQASADAKNRIKAIMTATEAKGREDLAQHFAYDTDMSAEAAVVALAKAPQPQAAAPAKTDAELHEARRLNAEGLNAGGTKPSGATMRVDIVANMKRRFGVTA